MQRFDLHKLRDTFILNSSMKVFLSASEVAKYLGVSPSTVTRWLNKGLIPGAVQPVGSGHQWRVPMEAAERLGRARS